MDSRETLREERLGAIFADWLEARERGETRDRRAWLAGHGDCAAELEALLADEERLQALAAPFRDAAQASRVTSALAAALAEASLPASFGDYELLERIGRGGMGVVYRARQKSLSRYVALKLCRAGVGDAFAGLTRFHHEAAMIAQLDHPHVVPIHEVGEYQGTVYFSMKWLEGGGLDAQLDRFRADPRASATLLAAAARAVHHAHQRGILHRDLKPSNILLDHAGSPHVTDFGLAKWGEADVNLTQSGALVGTPAYMAPEQAAGENKAITTATDVYGLGAVLYALLTGKAPFVGRTVLETLQLVKDGDVERPSRATRACRATWRRSA